MRRRLAKRLLGLLCALALCLSAPPIARAATDGGMIRVWLSSIRSNTAYNLTLAGTYAVAGQTLSSGSAVRVEFSGGQVYVTAGGTRQAMGTDVTIARQSGGVRIAESLAPGNTYPGDLRFVYSGSTAYVVCSLYIEDYLHGVLPYEMDNSFPLEALKAQAVAARTYAAFSRRSGSVYDVTDTTTHQVFRGVSSANPRCTQAVDETRGMVLRYGGAYIEASFGASNGGQTETRANAWGSSAAAYQRVEDDPYDLTNLRSPSKSYLIYYTPQDGTSTAAYSMIADALATQRGGSAADYTINAVTGVSAHTPRYAAPSRLYTRLRVDVRYNVTSTASVDIPIFPTAKAALGIGLNGTSNELISVTEEAKGFRVTARRYGHGIGLSQRGAQQRASEAIGYAAILAFYYPGATLEQVTFTTDWAGTSPGPSDGGGDTPSTPIDGVSARVSLANPSGRVNMRSAPRLDGGLIATLAHGTTVRVIGQSGTWYQVEHGALTGYIAGEYLILEEKPPDDGRETAYVTLKAGSLNLREAARATAGIIGTIPNGAKVTVLERGSAWTRVQYGAMDGYVMSQFLTGYSAPSDGGGTATGDDVAIVSLANPRETLNLRMDPATFAPILSRLPHGAALLVLERGGTWTKVAYQGLIGYVMNTYVRFEGVADPNPTPTPIPPPAGETWPAVVTTSGGTLNLRAAPNTTAYILRRIPNGTRLTVTQRGDSWCEVDCLGERGYVMRRYLYIEAGGVIVPTPTPSAVPSASATAQPSVAWVRTANGGGVNIRGTPSMQGEIIGAAPYGAEIGVLEAGVEWTRGQYMGVTGYIASAYLAYAAAAPSPSPTPTPTPTASLTEAVVVTANGGSVNLRDRPAANGEILGTVPHGARVTVIASDGSWSHVQYGTYVGYISSAYLQAVTPGLAASPAPSAAPSTTPSSAWVRTGNGGGVNIRSAPDGPIIGAAPYGAEVAILQWSDSWSYARYGGVDGYIASAYLSREAVAAPSRAASAAPSADVSDDEVIAWIWAADRISVGLRNAPSASGVVFTTIPHGTAVAVVETDDTRWAFIRYGNIFGYVDNESLEDTPP